jgi:ribosomal protein S18 acetylase RimI-like enzyme
MEAIGLIFSDYHYTDYDALMHLWMATGLSRPERGDSHPVIAKTIEQGGKLLLMKISPENRIIGSSWLTTDGRRLYLHHFGILPEYQGNGYSKQLLAESLKFAKQLGLQVKLEVHNSNTKALNLYKKAGFEPLGDYNVFIIRDIEKI